MINAIAVYLSATTPVELRDAYDALVEQYAADNEHMPDDSDFESGVDAILWCLGHLSLTERLNIFNAQEVSAQ